MSLLKMNMGRKAMASSSSDGARMKENWVTR
jgi:hypothetical protein